MLILDARGQQHKAPVQSDRIVSIVPSTTETLFDLGCGQRVVGATRFCIHPKEKLRSITRVGGTKNILWDKVLDLNPDLIIGNAEENTKEIFSKIDALGLNCYVPFPKTVQESLEDLLNMGHLLGQLEQAQQLHKEISQLINKTNSTPFSYAYLIWKKPWMAAGTDTFISDVLAHFGGINLINSTHFINTRYPNITQQLELLKGADKIFLSSEPYPFREKHISSLMSSTGLSRSQFQLIDGELCSWHGSRMKQAFSKLPELLQCS